METCPVCSNNGFRTKRLLSSIAIDVCTRCGFLISQIDRLAVQSEFSRINEDAYHKAIGVVRRHQAAEILSFVRTHSRGLKDWVDIGCSFGYLLFEAREAGYDVGGVEPDEKALAHARALLGENTVQQGWMTEKTAPDSCVDVISMLDVLEHIPPEDLNELARMINRKLRPEGLLVIKVPSTDGLYFRLAHGLLPISRSTASGFVKRLWQCDYEYPHTVYFNEETIKLFLQNNGFEPIAMKYLEELPSQTILNRLLMDNTIPRWQAILFAPGFLFINLIEKLRRKSDALLVVAKKK